MARHNDLGVQDHVLVSTIFQNRQYDFLHLLELEINVDSKDLNKFFGTFWSLEVSENQDDTLEWAKMAESLDKSSNHLK